MSFINFKLDNAIERPAPIPIAAAVSRTSRDGHVQHESSREVPSRESLVERICSTPAGRAASNKRRITNPRRNGACSECKNSKTRCEKLPTGPRGKCYRCLRLNKECALNPSKRLVPSARDFPNQPVPLPSTKKLRALQPQHEASPCHPESYGEGTLDTNSTLEAEASAAFLEGLSEACPCESAEPKDCSGHGLLTVTASRPLLSIRNKQLNLKIDSILSVMRTEQVFHQYISNFAPKCPMVVFPAGTTATLLRETKPLLFLSILSVAAAGYCTIDEKNLLAAEFRGYLAESVIVWGEKSLELVQALQVASLWYRATDHYTQINLNQLAHMATTMAIDLGLDKIEVLEPVGKFQDNWIRVEMQRAWLGCFLLSASLSLILRRQSAITWTPKMDDCLADLQRTEACPTDAFFSKLVTTERLCHGINKELFLSDPARGLSTRDSKTMEIIQSYQSRIDFYPLDQLDSTQNSLVDFGRSASLIYAHESALHINHNIDEFAAPFAAKSLRSCNFIDAQDLNASYLFILQTVIFASRKLLDAFLRLSVTDMLSLPPYMYGGRVIYAVILLMKVHKAITTSANGSGDVIKVEELHLEAYLEQLVVVSKILISKDERNSLSRAFLIMPQLKDWFYLHLFKKRSSADETNMIGGSPIQINSDNGQLKNTSHVPIGTPSDFSVADLSDCNTARKSLDELNQPTMTSCDPPAHSRESNYEVNGRAFAGDDWFWEFFNVDMLN